MSHLFEFLKLNRRVSGSRYLFWSLVLALVKYNVDRFVALSFGQRWDWWFYVDRTVNIWAWEAPGVDSRLQIILLAVSLPFLTLAILFTFRRLRSVCLPAWLVSLLFLPYVNFILFGLLVVLPTRSFNPLKPDLTNVPPRWLDRFAPHGRLASALASVLVTALFFVAVIFFGTAVLEQYGIGLFVGVPFCQSLLAVLIHGYRERLSIGEAVGVGILSVGLLAIILIGLAFEGLICLIMVAPLGLFLAVLGAGVGYAISNNCRPGINGRACLMLLLLPPSLMLGEMAGQRKPPTFEVVTRIEIDAPPEAVWRNVVAFQELPQAEEWLFRLGIAHPIRAEMFGTGVGAERHCIFSTGAFVEPIEVWDEPRLLKFSVTANPPPMEEWTPYEEVHPPHLDNYLVSLGGQFELVPVGHGRTRLAGTTWYRHGLWPAVYWRWWSDYIIHKIHRRVLIHIKHVSEP